MGRVRIDLLAEMEDMLPADIARELHEMSPERRAEVASALDDQKLADALEELPEDEQAAHLQAGHGAGGRCPRGDGSR